MTATMATLIPARLVRVNPLTQIARPAALSTRVFASRFSTSSDNDIIKIQQVPAPNCGHVRVLQLNRPAARNAISQELLENLSRQIKSIADENGDGSTRALVLGSAVDASFCAGADLKERAKMTNRQVEEFLSNLRATFKEIEALKIPTISAVSSMALGGGLELALTTHLRVFGSSSIVGLPETRLAIIPGAGGTYRLPAIVGPTRARDMILTGRRVSGPEAYFMGLCDRLVEVLPEEAQQEGVAREKVLRESIRLALDICEGGPIAVKQAILAVDGAPLREVSENAAYAKVIETEDRFEALRAFAEKRKPVFKGR